MALAMMSLVLGLILAITAQLGASHREASEKVDAELARQNAMLAFQIALGELQKDVGADRRLTASAEALELAQTVEHPKWLGVWNGGSGSVPLVSWLVSGNSPQPGSAISEPIRVVGPGSVKGTTAEYVFVERVPMPASGQSMGAYGYWVGDESAKADVSMNAPITRVSPELARVIYEESPSIAGSAVSENTKRDWGRSLINQSQNNRVSFDFLLKDYWSSDLDQDAPEFSETFERIGQFSELTLVGRPNGSSESLFHSLTTNSAGVLENAIDGGLRYIVDGWLGAGAKGAKPGYVRTGDILDQPELEKYLDHGRNFTTLLPKGLSVAADGSYRNPNLKPILTEAMVRFSVFNRSNYPAMRFYIDAEFYNPYPYPLLLNIANNRAYHVAFRNLPDIRLEKRRYAEDGSEIVGARDSTGWIPMDNIPLSSSSGDRWTASWINFDINPSAFGSPRRFTDRRPFLFPGEVFRVEDPDSVAQPQGLWKAIQYAVGVGDRSIGSVQPSDTVIVEGRHQTSPTGTKIPTFDVEVYKWDASSAPRWNDPNLESDLIFAVRNIPYDEFTYEFANDPPYLQGSGFSNDIDVSAFYVFAFHFRLGPRWDGPDAVDLLESIDLRKPEIDYSGTFVDRNGNTRYYSEFVRIASTNPIDVNNNVSAIFPGEDLFADSKNGLRSSRDNAFRDIRPYDLPMRDPLSIADLRHVAVDGRPPVALGSEWGSQAISPGSADLNEAFDRYYVSTVPTSSSVWNKNGTSALPNPRLLLTQEAQGDSTVTNARLRQSDASRYFKIRGSFNLNSTSVDAWHAVLTNEFVDGTNAWAFNGRTDSTRGENLQFQDNLSGLRNTFFRRPFSAGYEADPIADDGFGGGTRLAGLSDDNGWNSSMFNQGFRALEGDDLSLIGDDQLRHLAWHIVDGLKAYVRDNGHPVASIADFLETGILGDAIRAVGTTSLSAEMIAERLSATAPINDFSVPAPPAGTYPKDEHPSALRQSDVAAQLTPFLSHRSDTFIIRAYGETTNTITGEVVGKAMVEARVQRLPQKVLPTGPNDINSEAKAERLGRKFKILSFRWIDPDEA